MKTKILMLFLMLFAVTTAFAAEKRTEVFTLDHQMSTHCEKKIIQNLRFEKGITDLKVNLKENTITIIFNPAKTDSGQIIKAFKKIGFNAFLVSKEEPQTKQETAEPSSFRACYSRN